MDEEPRKLNMGDYIEEAPFVARANLARADELVAPLIGKMGSVPRRLTLVASGSSGNAALCALPFMRSCLGRDCGIRVIPPFSFTRYEVDALDDDDQVIVISQSGLSTNAIAALDALRAGGRAAWCLTGNTDADIRDHADEVFDYGVGEELVGYVTKGVTTLALYLMVLASRLSGRRGRDADLARAFDVADAVRVGARGFFEQHEKALTSMSSCYCMGAGPTWGVACEGALKIGETIHVPSPAYEVEEFIHGPNLQLTPAHTAFFFDAGDAASIRVQQIWRASREVTDRAFLLTTDTRLGDAPGAMAVLALSSPDTASLAFLPFVQTISFLASDELGSAKQHPLLKRFKKVVSAKTASFVNYDGDE